MNIKLKRLLMIYHALIFVHIGLKKKIKKRKYV